YVPARDVLLSEEGDLPDEEIERKRRDKLRRSGLVLDDPEVLHAMEAGDSPVRLPVKWKEGVPTGDSLASAERLGLLGRRVEENLRALASQLRSQHTADPCYKGAQDNACLRCDTGGLPLHGGRGQRQAALPAQTERHARVGHAGRRRGKWLNSNPRHRRSWPSRTGAGSCWSRRRRAAARPACSPSGSCAG
ncbi:MAG: hypothetical protein ACLUEK_05485, partial [Oscillospiraceae bacterium]